MEAGKSLGAEGGIRSWEKQAKEESREERSRQEFWAQGALQRRRQGDYLSSTSLPACTASPKGGGIACQNIQRWRMN